MRQPKKSFLGSLLDQSPNSKQQDLLMIIILVTITNIKNINLENRVPKKRHNRTIILDKTRNDSPMSKRSDSQVRIWPNIPHLIDYCAKSVYTLNMSRQRLQVSVARA